MIRFTVTRSHGRTPWGVFGNVWPTSANRIDRATVGGWYVNIHTPWRVIEVYNTHA
jgi:hypothetical protein